jgi:hypothetical protein
LLAVAAVCFVGSYLLAEFAFTWFGHDCGCTSLQFGGELCAARCMSVFGMSVPESAGKVVLPLVLPAIGALATEWLIKRAEGRLIR